MNPRFLACCAALLVTGLAGQAFALDGYRDRRGLYFGINVGGGAGQAELDGAKADRNLGLTIGARIGGGINKRLTLDLSVDGYFQTGKEEAAGGVEFDVDTNLWSGLLGGSFFLADGLYVRGGFGLASIEQERTSKTDTGGNSDEVGIGFSVGGGYEFFANGDLAVGAGGDFRAFTFDEITYNVVNIGITATWY